MPGTDDLACVKAEPGRTIVRILTPRGKEFRWRSKDSFSIWDADLDDWIRTKANHRKTWPSVERAEAWLAKQ